MDKVISHFKNNALIYIIILACVTIIGISLFVTSHGSNLEKVKVNTESFNVITLDQALDLFKEKDAHILVIGHEECKATADYVKYLEYAQIENNFKTYYLELKGIEDFDKLRKLGKLLNVEYTFRNETKEFGEFLGSTPMTVVIKDKKMVYGYLGSMSNTSLDILAQKYELK